MSDRGGEPCDTDIAVELRERAAQQREERHDQGQHEHQQRDRDVHGLSLIE